jgi:hypothetical protein
MPRLTSADTPAIVSAFERAGFRGVRVWNSYGFVLGIAVGDEGSGESLDIDGNPGLNLDIDDWLQGFCELRRPDGVIPAHFNYRRENLRALP